MRGIARLTGFTHAVTFDRLDQQYSGLPFVFLCILVGCVNLVRIMTTAQQAPDIVVRHIGDELQCLGIFAEEMLAHISTVFGFVVLVLAIDGFHHDPLQNTVLVSGQQVIPVRSPNHLDHIPASATEIGFEFLNDFAVAAHRAIQTLQITVDDENEVIEHFTAGHADRAHRLRFIHLAITAESPDLAIGGIGNLTRMQVFEKPRLINRHQRT